MYLGKENQVIISEGTRICYDSALGDKIRESLLKSIKMCPPFDAYIKSGPSKNVLNISFFNEFDSRTLSEEQFAKILDGFRDIFGNITNPEISGASMTANIERY